MSEQIQFSGSSGGEKNNADTDNDNDFVNKCIGNESDGLVNGVILEQQGSLLSASNELHV